MARNYRVLRGVVRDKFEDRQTRSRKGRRGSQVSRRKAHNVKKFLARRARNEAGNSKSGSGQF
jgi:hypothetical protein